jgi:hypothetical protein
MALLATTLVPSHLRKVEADFPKVTQHAIMQPKLAIDRSHGLTLRYQARRLHSCLPQLSERVRDGDWQA